MPKAAAESGGWKGKGKGILYGSRMIKEQKNCLKRADLLSVF
jgi:hypothetical protein